MSPNHAFCEVGLQSALVLLCLVSNLALYFNYVIPTVHLTLKMQVQPLQDVTDRKQTRQILKL